MNPFDIVEAESKDNSFGLVMNLEHSTGAGSHLSTSSPPISATPRRSRGPGSERDVPRCNVLSNTEEIYMPVPRRCARALRRCAGHPQGARRRRLPENKISRVDRRPSNGTKAPCYLRTLSARAEGAHMVFPAFRMAVRRAT